MEYGAFKALHAPLFFGAAPGFGFWQLVTVNREIRRDAERRERQEPAQESSRRA